LHDLSKRNGNPRAVDKEQTKNDIRFSFWEDIMIRIVMEEAIALASLTLFIGMIVVWAVVLASST
jgi:hypothetical protein